jgi:zinc protease
MELRRAAAMFVAATLGAWTFAAPSSAQTPTNSPASAPSGAPLPPPLSRAQLRTLDNGLRVVVLEDHAAPVAAIQVWYRFGSADETPGKTGLAHALEHMMFRGTQTLSASGLDEWTAGLGASINAQTTPESTRFDTLVPADRVETVLRIEADRMQHLKLDPADWDKERGAVLQEAAQDRSNPLFALEERLNQELYPGSPLGRSALGERADVERASVADLRAYYERWYAPNDATIVVAGDVDAGAVFAAAERWFGSIPARPLPDVVIPSPVAASGISEHERADVPFTVVDLVYALPPLSGATYDEGVRTLIAITALAQSDGALQTALYDSRLTLGYLLQPAVSRRVAALHLIAFVAPGHTADEFRAVAQATLQRLAAQGLDADDVEATKRTALAQLAYARDSVVGIAQLFGAAYVFPDTEDPAVDIANLASITKAQADAAVRRTFARPNAVAILEPTRTDASTIAPTTSFAAERQESFGGRVPDGPVVEPEWLRADAARLVALHSRVAPTIETLPNGLRLLVLRVPDNPTVFVAGTMRRSPSFDPPGKVGTGYLAAALMSAGSLHYPDDELQRVGRDLGATLSFGDRFSAHGFARDLPKLLDALADDLQHPLLPPDRFALLKAQLAPTLARQALDATYRAQRAFVKALFPADDPALRALNLESLDAITLDDVRSFAQRYNRPDLTTIAIVGDVDPTAVHAAVVRAFGDWKAVGATPEATLPPLPLPAPAHAYVEDGDAQDVAVEIGQPAPRRGDRDADAFLIADSLLDDRSFASRLFQEVRQKRGLVYTIGTNYNYSNERGTWTASFRAMPSKVDAADALVLQEVRRLASQPVGLDELRRCETRQALRAILAEESMQTVAADVLTIGAEGLPMDFEATLAGRYAAVTPDDVRRAAQEYFHPDHWVEVRTGPKR